MQKNITKILTLIMLTSAINQTLAGDAFTQTIVILGAAAATLKSTHNNFFDNLKDDKKTRAEKAKTPHLRPSKKPDARRRNAKRCDANYRSQFLRTRHIGRRSDK